jgi:hypothetical protein
VKNEAKRTRAIGLDARPRGSRFADSGSLPRRDTRWILPFWG